MNRLILLSVLVLSLNCVNGQNDLKTATKKAQLVRVKDWGQHAMVIVEPVWQNIKPQIVDQVGVSKFEDIKKNYDYKSVPEEMSLFAGGKRKDLPSLHKKLSQLQNISKLAGYTNTDDKPYVILQVPYKGNENWDTNAKWDTVYFIFPETAIEYTVK